MAAERDLDWIIGRFVSGESLDADEQSWLEQKMQEDPDLSVFVEELIWQEKIEAYQEGKMSEENKTDFEYQLTENEELRRVWEQHQATIGALELKRRYRHITTDAKPDSSGKDSNKESGKSNWRNLLMLFGFLFVAGTLYLWVMNGNDSGTLTGSPDPAPDEEISGPGEPSAPTNELSGQEKSISGSLQDSVSSTSSEPENVEQRSLENSRENYQDSIRQAGKRHIRAAAELLSRENVLSSENSDPWEINYKNSEYQNVIRSLNKQRDSLLNAYATRKLLYLATSMLLAPGNSTQGCNSANELLQEILMQKDKHQPRYLERVSWFYAMSLICLERQDEAFPIIESIVQSGDNPYKREAEQLYGYFAKDTN